MDALEAEIYELHLDAQAIHGATLGGFKPDEANFLPADHPWWPKVQRAIRLRSYRLREWGAVRPGCTNVALGYRLSRLAPLLTRYRFSQSRVGAQTLGVYRIVSRRVRRELSRVAAHGRECSRCRNEYLGDLERTFAVVLDAAEDKIHELCAKNEALWGVIQGNSLGDFMFGQD